MDAPLRDLAALATIALLSVAVILVLRLSHERRRLMAQLEAAHSETQSLRHRLADATRPPTQFARMRLREDAVVRFARLRRAVPRRRRGSEPAQAESARISPAMASAQARTAAGSVHRP